MSRRVLTSFALFSALAGTAQANGRVPAAQHVVVGPGARSDVIALRTTFGLLISRDGGRSFRWLCEDAMFAPVSVGATTDPAVEVTADGTVVFGFERGVHSTVDGCHVTRHASAADRFIVDLTHEPTGQRVWAIESAWGERNRVLRASAADLVFTPLGAGVERMIFTTLDVAPSDPRRLYAGATELGTGAPRLLRSDDGGETLRSRGRSSCAARTPGSTWPASCRPAGRCWASRSRTTAAPCGSRAPTTACCARTTAGGASRAWATSAPSA